ncbi:hypothetical protein [Nitrosococcus wardiae]|uniref:Uncharacterized protein n=1 Tax=Nitrosococcus wardiae TaxID=1814290 RepID=A0A4P7C4G1_9GAMM|nr:hypothetical protein [Nitrosococcus wardiae]QBQ55816.1 hypothetical protein E3U44_15820 [Nitrosococcus wardiae]
MELCGRIMLSFAVFSTILGPFSLMFADSHDSYKQERDKKHKREYKYRAGRGEYKYKAKSPGANEVIPVIPSRAKKAATAANITLRPALERKHSRFMEWLDDNRMVHGKS